MTFILFIFIFVVINILLAKRDAKKILLNDKINHLNNAIVYALLCAAGIFFFHGLPYIKLLIALFLVRKIVFDIALNKFRGLSWDYVSETTESKIDKIENWIFDYNGSLMYRVYFIFLIVDSLWFYLA